jgi:Na+:H+ antiporter
MDELILLIFGLTALLALTALMLPVANRINLPFTVLLAAIGIVLGFFLQFSHGAEMPGAIGDLLRTFSGFRLTSETILFLFLPTLVFESALSIDARALIKELLPILFLAVVGLLVSTFIVGYSIFTLTDQLLVTCLLVGAIVSATDPVAVVAIFRDLGAPHRLALLVEGESLFNDATAIVMFTLLAGMLTGVAEPSLLSGSMSFLAVFLGGALLGFVLGQIVLFVLAKIEDLPLVENTLTVALAYLSFIIAEHYLHVSGVMAVVVSALVIGARGRTVLSKAGWEMLESLWGQIGFWANSLIFVLAGMVVPTILISASFDLMLPALVVIAAAFVARLFILFGMLPALGRLYAGAKVSSGFRAVMFWGGLRGAVSLALALIVLETPGIAEPVKVFVATMVVSLVLFTLFINATTIRPLLALFGLDQLPPADAALRRRVLADALTEVQKTIDQAASQYTIEDEAVAGLERSYLERVRDLQRDETDLDHPTWVRVGLQMLLRFERHRFEERMDQGLVDQEITRTLLAQNDRFRDAVRTGGGIALQQTQRTATGYSSDVLRGVWLQRHVGWSRGLARALARRFTTLQAARVVLDDMLEREIDALTDLVPGDVMPELRAVYEHRLADVRKALDALEAQYPEYAKALRNNLLALIALRHEQDRYQRMLDDGVIGHEIYHDLQHDLIKRRDVAREHPPLDLGLDPERLVSQVELFQNLDQDTIKQITGLLRPQLALPEEFIMRAGQAGDCMYFVSSGAAEVMLEGGHCITLGSGEFFGEIALIKDQPRVADVRALCFTDLLVLYRKDFQTLLDQEQTLRDVIHRTAEERSS